MTIADATKDYFHINRMVHWSPFKKWEVGEEIDIGGESNPYFSFFESQQKTYPVNTDSGVVNVPGVHFIGEIARGAIQSSDAAKISNELVTHFVAYVRELIWEDIRKTEFPHLPSRQRCIWLIPSREGVAFWLNALGVKGQDYQIARVQLQGRLHVGSNEHLLGDSEPMLVTIKRARQYWLGISNSEATQEVLFEGRIRVKEFIDPAEFT
ncbi:DUF2441 domain-containing protein [Aeromonas hydrophila]|uniref:DUF2441 domain-containing protein n=1 Tax=Aeromonas hydrophila TaxID=644 RepID=UPI001C05000C|nr:DUF2441 domain-containing protein [Aeromonas hydrophila]QWL80823.1 DUF2441 domain-containing protein [Aeromonas hydrophila]